MNSKSKLEILANVGAFIVKHRVSILWESPKGIVVSCHKDSKIFTSSSKVEDDVDAIIAACRDLYKQLEWQKGDLNESKLGKGEIVKDSNSGISGGSS